MCRDEWGRGLPEVVERAMNHSPCHTNLSLHYFCGIQQAQQHSIFNRQKAKLLPSFICLDLQSNAVTGGPTTDSTRSRCLASVCTVAGCQQRTHAATRHILPADLRHRVRPRCPLCSLVVAFINVDQRGSQAMCYKYTILRANGWNDKSSHNKI